MITDIFARRYDEVLSFNLDTAQNVIGPVLIQAAQIFFDDVQPVLCLPDSFFQKLNQKLARELALSALYDYAGSTQQEICSRFMGMPYRGFGELERDPDYYCKTRLSMLELLFREAEAQLRKGYLPAPSARMTVNMVKVRAKMKKAIEELNVRLQHFRFVYNNGLLHLADDQLSAQRIAAPFWEIVTDPKWSVVDREMKEAFDRLDHSQQDALTYATKALESTIKIISGNYGWTTGKERGAANFIEHLRSNGFIAAWEEEAMKLIFSKLRNPYSHGGGHAPPAPLSRAQQTWAIENCMSWIKSLVRRM